jgi:hypothetical protein
MESTRAGLAPGAVRARAAFHTAKARRGFCFGSVTVTWDTDGDCDCPACRPSPTRIAEYDRPVAAW